MRMQERCTVSLSIGESAYMYVQSQFSTFLKANRDKMSTKPEGQLFETTPYSDEDQDIATLLDNMEPVNLSMGGLSDTSSDDGTLSPELESLYREAVESDTSSNGWTDTSDTESPSAGNAPDFHEAGQRRL